MFALPPVSELQVLMERRLVGFTFA